MNAGKLDRFLNSKGTALALHIIRFILGFAFVASFFLTIDWWRKVKYWFEFIEGDAAILVSLLFANCVIPILFIVIVIIALVRYSKTMPDIEKLMFKTVFIGVVAMDVGVTTTILIYGRHTKCQEYWEKFNKEKYEYAGWEAYWERLSQGIEDHETLIRTWQNRRCDLPSTLLLISFGIKYFAAVLVFVHKYVSSQAFSKGYNQLPLKERQAPNLQMDSTFTLVTLDDMPIEDLSSRK